MIHSFNICLRRLLMLGALTLSGASVAWAVPTGYSKSVVDTSMPNGALAFAPDGTLYIAQGYSNYGDQTHTIKVIKPDGTFGTTINVTGVTFGTIGGMTYDTTTNKLLLTDNFNFGGDTVLYSVDPTTGAGATITPGVGSISDVAVRSSGQLFITDAAGAGAGAVYSVNRTTGTKNPTPVLGGLTYASGLTFDANQNLIVQDVTYDNITETSTGHIYRVPITQQPDSSLTYGSAVPLADVPGGSFDVAVDSSNNIFVSGSGGLFKIDASTNAVTTFEANGTPLTTDFFTSLAYFPGSQPFTPGGSPALNGRLDYLTSLSIGHSSSSLSVITSVPEPSTLVLMSLSIGLLGAYAYVRRRKTRMSVVRQR